MTTSKPEPKATKKSCFHYPRHSSHSQKLLNGKTLLLAVTIGVNAAISAIASPSPQELNLTPRPVISNRTERTIALIACEGASNGLPKADLQIAVYADVLRSASRYSPAEFKTITDQIVKKSGACSPRANVQLNAKK